MKSKNLRQKNSLLGFSGVLKGVCMAMLLLFSQAVFAQDKEIKLDFQNVPMSRVMQRIESQSSYKFFHNSDINTSRIVSVSVTSSDIDEVVGQLVRDMPVDYKISGQRIVLFVKNSSGMDRAFAISGTIKDEAGPVIGASVVNQDGYGVVTNLDGYYSLDGVRVGDLLTVSCLGYETQDIVFDGRQTTLNVLLAEETEFLDEVVVTALGIKKEAKALSYNVQDLSGDELVTVKDANFVNSLNGKIAGVNINASSAGIGGGAKVVMRGAKSISGNNNALYVVDGIPMPQLSYGQPNDYFSGMGQTGDGASMINPEDIENISVLSGAAAAALYGSDAANGVIMITTKKGSAEKLTVTYSNNTTFMSPFRTPEFQNTYGAVDESSFQSWGAKLATPSSYDPLDFYQTGWNETNALTVSTGNDKNQTFLSMATTNAEGLVENNTLDRYNFTVRNTTNFCKDKLHLDLSATYMNVREQNMVSEGQYFNPIVATYLMSPSYSLETYQMYEIYDASRGFKTQNWPWGNQGLGMQNPYWVINRDTFVNHKNRFLVSGGLNWDIYKGITLSGRAKMDYTSAIYERKYSASTDAIFAGDYGLYAKADESTRQIYADVLLNIDKYFGQFSLNANVGASIQDVNYNYYSIRGDLNSVANSFTLQNLNTTNMWLEQENYHDQTQSLFATIQFGWRSMLYLDLAGRIDWSSALAYSDYSYVAYPSIGLSAVLSEMWAKNKVLTFLKIRGSYSEVGNTPTRYITYQTHPYSDGSPTTASTYPNTNIRPERTKAWEVGLQAKFWGDKLDLNVSLYQTNTFNQLFNPDLAASSGYSSIYINGGEVANKGLELSFGVNQPLGPVQWNSTYTYTINRNKIKKLLNETDLGNGVTVSQNVLDLYSIGNMKTRLVEGGSIGDIYVTALTRDEHGYVVVDYKSNSVSVDRTAGDLGDGWVYAGNSEAKYTMGWRNSFSWKGISLSFLITARVGGICTSMTQALMDQYGVSKATADARDAAGVVVDGCKIPNVQQFYQTVASGAGEFYVYSATNVRLGELSVGYDIPLNKWVHWIHGLNVAFTGHNLFFFYCKAPYDPELTASTETHFSGMDYFMQPSMRSLGFSVKLTL